MQADQDVGIELPLKALVWQDANGKTWVSYNDPGWIAKRHGLDERLNPIVDKMDAVIAEVAGEAAGVK